MRLMALVGVAVLGAGCPGDDAGVEETGGSSSTGTHDSTGVVVTTLTTGGQATMGATGTDTTMGPVDTGTTASTGPGETTATTGETTEGSSSGSTGSTGATESSTGDTEGSTTGNMGPCQIMLPPPGVCGGPGVDPPGIEFECNPITQDDCMAGQKCMPWANDGGGSWNATACQPLDPAPVQVGDVCTVQGSGVSGVDNCDIGQMCWDVDPMTNEGTCIELCGCSYDDPQCQTPNTVCAVVNGGVLPLCVQVCNPLDPAACPMGQGCYPVGEYFQCVPDASGGMGMAGDPCEFINGCESGFVCVGSASYPGCVGVGCCAPTCDVNDPAPGCPAGTGCEPFYEPGMEPDACLGSAGVCILPP